VRATRCSRSSARCSKRRNRPSTASSSRSR
jgi:hypothetical protein